MKYSCFGLPRWLSDKESTCQGRRLKRRRFETQVEKIHWRRRWQPTPILLPRKLHGWRSLVGYSPWGHKESDTISASLSLSYSLLGLRVPENWNNYWNHYMFPCPCTVIIVLTARESVSLPVVSDSVTLWTVVRQALLSLGFSRQQCWNGLPCPPAGNLPDPGIEPRSPALQEDSLPSEPPGKQQEKEIFNLKCWAWIFSL